MAVFTALRCKAVKNNLFQWLRFSPLRGNRNGWPKNTLHSAAAIFLLLRNKKQLILMSAFLAAVRQPKRRAEKIASASLRLLFYLFTQVFRRAAGRDQARGACCWPIGGRGPKMAVPTRTRLAPSRMASAKSPLMPIERYSIEMLPPACRADASNSPRIRAK